MSQAKPECIISDPVDDNARSAGPIMGWLRVAIGLVSLLALGTVYSWSVFRKPLQAELNLNATQSLLPYTLALLFYAALMPLAGAWIEKFGPRKIFLFGAAFVLVGYLLAAFAPSIWFLTIGYGIFAGAGVGISYGIPLAVSARWLPESRGLAIGCTVVGFGLSPLLTAPIAAWLIHQLGVRTALAIVGLGISLLLLLASRWMTFPPHIPPSDSNSNPPKQAIPHHSSTPWFAALLTNRKFLTLWICFFLGTFLGLTAIGISASVGQELFHLSPLQAASWLSLFALFNGLARPPLGALADRFPPSWLAGFLYFIAGTASLLFYFLPKTSVLLYVSGFSALWFTLGGWLALAPATTARLFGQQHFARNYGLLFTAYGFGALSGTLSAGRLRDFTGSYVSVFLLLAAVAFLGIILASQIRTTKSN